MTVTIDGNTVVIPTTLEAQISEAAAAWGEDRTRFAVAALTAGVETEEFDPDAVGGLQEGLVQLDTGQGQPFTEFVAEVRAAR